MAISKKYSDTDLDVGIGLSEGKQWSKSKSAKIDAFIKQESAKGTPEQVLKNEILAVRYQMEREHLVGRPIRILWFSDCSSRSINSKVKNIINLKNV